MENEKTNSPQTRKEILVASVEAREQEVMHYQINIDNYALALIEISKMSGAERQELSKFSDQLQELLASEKLEQKKAKIMLAVIKRQIA
jgi:hypothetical protein